MGRTTIRTAGLCLIVILAGVALAGCMDSGEQGPSDDGLPGSEDGTGDSGEPSSDGTGDEQTDGDSDATGDETADGDSTSEDGEEQTSSTPQELSLQTPDVWPGPGFDHRRTKAFASQGGGTGDRFYTIQPDAELLGRPVVANGLMFVTAEVEDRSDGGEGLLIAYDVNTGAQVFTFETNKKSNVPLAAGNGLVFIQTHEEGLYALDETGETVWHNEGGDASAAMTFADGVLYVTFNGQLFALDPQTGENQWQKQPEGDNAFSGHPVVLEDRILVLGSGEGGLYAIDPETQETEWSADVQGGISFMAPSVADGRAFVANLLGDRIQAVDIETGEREWEIDRKVGLMDDLLLPILPDGKLLIGNVTNDGTYLEALDPASGELAWTALVDGCPSMEDFNPGTFILAWVVADESIHVWAASTCADTVQAFDSETGERQWWTESHEPDYAVGVDGVLFSVAGGDVPTEIVARDGGYS